MTDIQVSVKSATKPLRKQYIYKVLNALTLRTLQVSIFFILYHATFRSMHCIHRVICDGRL